MQVSFEKNTTIVAEANVATDLFTAPHPMGGANYAALTLTLQSIIDQSTGAGAGIGVGAQGSNDGVEYADVTTVVLNTVTTTGVHVAAGDFPYAFIRFHISMNPNGNPGELALMTFDLQANLTRR